MTSERLEAIFREIIRDCFNVLTLKGRAYSGQKDTLMNFKKLAQITELPVLKVWLVYFQKHIDAICSYINGYYNDLEPIDGRIIDAINYLILLKALIEDNKTEEV